MAFRPGRITNPTYTVNLFLPLAQIHGLDLMPGPV